MKRKKISLALQGGGSHGAYTWGVLERLLEEDRFDFQGFCGASSGAMNGVVAAYGLHIGGYKKAIELLDQFWSKIGDGFSQSLIKPTILDELFGSPGSLEHSPAFHLTMHFASIVSPYDLDPEDKNTNHLKDLLLETIDFKELRKSKVKIFASATNVITSKPKVFNHEEMTIETLMASAALPLLYKAVKIDGECYWDGIFLCNPQIQPLIDHTKSDDILIVKLCPVETNYIPESIPEIQNRISQIN